MTLSIFNTNLLDTNLIFGGIVLSGAAFTYFLGHSIYYGYRYYYSNPIDTSSNGTSSSGANTPIPSDIESGSTTPMGPECIMPSYRNAVMKWKYNYRDTQDASVQTDNLLKDSSIQTDEQMLMDYFNELAWEMQSDTRLSVSTSFVGSPLTPSTRIKGYLDGVVVPSSRGVQTDLDANSVIDLVDLMVLLSNY